MSSSVENFMNLIQCPIEAPTNETFLEHFNLTIDENFDPDEFFPLSEAEELELKIKSFIFTTFYVLTFLFGLIGNALVIYLILKIKKLQSITSLFLMSLAFADLLLIVICVPMKIAEFLSDNHWIFGSFMCRLYHYLHTFTAICSVLNLTAMSFERYLAIIHPLKAKIRCTHTRAKIIIFLTWILSIFAALPVLLGKKLVKLGYIDKIDVCMKVWCDGAWRIFEIYRTVLLLVIPFSIMAYCYFRISLELYSLPIIRRKKKDPKGTSTMSKSDMDQSNENITLQTEISTSNTFNKQQQHPAKTIPGKNISFRSSADDEATRKQIIKILMSIVGIFFICWAPITINNTLIAFGVVPREAHGLHWYLRIVFHLLAYMNSCVNPIVYGFMSKRFRDGFKKAFCSSTRENQYISMEFQQKSTLSENVRNNKLLK